MDKTKIHKMWIADQGDGTYTNPILYTGLFYDRFQLL